MDSNEKFPVSWMLSIILLVFVCMLIISEDRRITSVTEYNYLAENVALMKQRMDAINNRFNDMLKKVEDERLETDGGNDLFSLFSIDVSALVAYILGFKSREEGNVKETDSTDSSKSS